MLCHILYSGFPLALFASICLCQQVLPDGPVQPGAAPRTENNNQPPAESGRILWIIPNHRSSPSLQNYVPLTIGEKFKIATKDAFDPGTMALGALFGGESQLTNGNRSFGQGGAGFGRYFGAADGGFLIGHYMTDAVFPSL